MSSAKNKKVEYDREGFAQRLTEIRGSATLWAFAKELGVSYQNLQNYLHGTEPSASFLAILIRKRNVDIGWLLMGKSNPLLTEEQRANIVIKEDAAHYDKAPSSEVMGEVAHLAESGNFDVTITISPARSRESKKETLKMAADTSEKVSARDAESDLMGCGQSLARFLTWVAAVACLVSVIVFTCSIYAETRPETTPGFLPLLVGAALLAFFGAGCFILGSWIESYSWVVARSSKALRKLTENRGQ